MIPSKLYIQKKVGHFVKKEIFFDYLGHHRKSYNNIVKNSDALYMANNSYFTFVYLINQSHWMTCLFESYVCMEIYAAINLHA